ncbi:protein FAM110A [Notamacropus eugenii]|uniref:protein FAM110A n=1 Tax=Notamacropus eugenii TaxID=9315 RepID=UPI003B682ED0
MPVETLPTAGSLKEVAPGAPCASSMPFRILTKGPGYFRRQGEGNVRKPSAVERLEADKAKYVKSLRVASTRQEPIKPLLLKQPLFSPGVRRAMLTPNRRSPGMGSRRAEACGARASLNMDVLSNLINLCDSPAPLPDGPPPERKWKAGPSPGLSRMSLGDGKQMSPATEGSLSTPLRPPSIAAVRRVDVRPTGEPQIRAMPSSPASPCSNLGISPGPSPQEGPRRLTHLHRSKSDLSDRFSRATADLERFFNYCGLDPEEAQGLGVEHFARASSDIVSVKFHSVSTSSSEGTRSQRSEATAEDRARDRTPYGVSVIERNARVIKWLYGLRQAREAAQRASNV